METSERNKDPSVARVPHHDLDALRASAMLLGIAYHAALSFAATFPWLVQDISQSKAFYVFQFSTRGFRMPLFFLVSGFFTAMLRRQQGFKALLWHRFRRILLPCLLGLVTVVPAMIWTSSKAIESGIRKQSRLVARSAASDLWSAAASGHTGTVARLLAEGADVSGLQADFGVTALTTVALMGHANVAGQFVDAGANVNARNRGGGTRTDPDHRTNPSPGAWSENPPGTPVPRRRLGRTPPAA